MTGTARGARRPGDDGGGGDPEQATAPPDLLRLRPVDVHPIEHQGVPALALRDPLGLAEAMIAVPQVLAPALALMDGTRDEAGVHAALIVRYGLDVGAGTIARLVAALDEALLLDNDRARQASEVALAAYRAAPDRASLLAGASYPGDADDLRAMLDGYLEGVGDAVAEGPAEVRGVVSPHIDYARGGAAYARVWRRAGPAARSAELVVLLGTDHQGRHAGLTVTRQSYRTPYGVLPTAVDVVDAVVAALGEADALGGELHHRAEHSVELAAIWLHHVRDGAAVPIVPILCGSFGGYLGAGATPADDPRLSAFLAALQGAVAGRRLLVVAAADLSHVGPAFGGPPVDRLDAARLGLVDDRLIEAMVAGDAEMYFDAIRTIDDRTNVCGTPPIYLALRLLGGASGELVAYERCPADAGGTSLVSVCGIVLI